MLTRRRFAVVLGVVLLAGVAALGVSAWVWAKSYSPLRVTAYGPGVGVSAQPVGGGDDAACPAASHGCGQLAFIVRGARTRIAEFHLVVKNDGRWPITIQRRDVALPCHVGNCLLIQSLRSTRTAGRFHPLRVDAHASADVWVRFRSTCRQHQPGYGSGSYTLPLAYRYLHVFEHTQNVQMPFDVDYLC